MLNKWLTTAFVTVLGLAGFNGSSQAALTAVDLGPYTAATGFFPLWYRDSTNSTLDLCLSKAASANGPMCVLLANPGVFDPALPIVFPFNFPDESFWYAGDASIDLGQGNQLIYVSALEAAFGGPAGLPAPGDQVSFARIRIRVDIAVPGHYKVTHPYGVEIFKNVPAGRRAINMTRDIGIGATGVFTGALGGDIGPFLRSANAPAGYTAINPDTGAIETFVGDPNLLEPVTGSPFGTNFVRIQQVDASGNPIAGGFGAETKLFAVSGRIWNEKRPTAVAVDRSTYSRNASGTKIDVFASSTPSATVSFRETLPLGTERAMTGDGAGKFYAQDAAPVTLPPYVIVTARDGTVSTPSSLASALTDVVKITKAQYAKGTQTLFIDATSSDETSIPTLTAVGFGKLTLIPGTTTQRLQVSGVAEPPASVTLVSAAGGRDTEPVVVVAAAAVNHSPVANPDSATTNEDTPVTISVLTNDSDSDGDALTVTAVSDVTNGSAVINGDATVTFTPAPNFSGTRSFNYVVSDGNGGTAMAAVTVTVNAVNDPPVAGNDTATTAANTPVTINVLANDTDVDGGSLTVSAVTNGANGTVTPNGSSVTYAPNASFTGSDSFTYTVSDGNGGTATGTVTVTVVAALNVDLNITAFTVSNRVRLGQTVTISVTLRNNGTVDQFRPATVTGVQNGVTVYNQTVQVRDGVGGATTRNPFPSFTVTQGGNITWRVEVFDDNADLDEATVTTTAR